MPEDDPVRYRLDDTDIGLFVKRTGHEARWHHVQSVVADGAFTKCGRRMKPKTSHGDGFLVELDPPAIAVCFRCR
jgi:hypothetical protein